MEERKIKDSKKSDFFIVELSTLSPIQYVQKIVLLLVSINNKIFCILNPNRKVDCVVVFFKSYTSKKGMKIQFPNDFTLIHFRFFRHNIKKRIAID